MKERIESIFNALQGLDIKGTLNNTRIMAACLQELQNVYAELSQMEANHGKDDQTE